MERSHTTALSPSVTSGMTAVHQSYSDSVWSFLILSFVIFKNLKCQKVLEDAHGIALNISTTEVIIRKVFLNPSM